MTITKLGHSCVLVETDDRIGLFDPGVWSEINFQTLPQIDRLAISHQHADHMDPDLIKRIIQHSPGLHIVANQAVTAALQAAEVQPAAYRGDRTQCTVPFAAPHEPLPWPDATAPDNTGYHFKDLFTHPGDSFSFQETKLVLALPVIAPWGKLGDAIALAGQLQPKYIVPIHDWHYNDQARTAMYNKLRVVFARHGSELICDEIGEPYEI